VRDATVPSRNASFVPKPALLRATMQHPEAEAERSPRKDSRSVRRQAVPAEEVHHKLSWNMQNKILGKAPFPKRSVNSSPRRLQEGVLKLQDPLTSVGTSRGGWGERRGDANF